MQEKSELGRLFGEVSRRQGGRIHREVSKLGLGRGMPPVLLYVAENDGCRQSDINKLAHVAPATTTVMLQTLEKNGFITRRTDENDQRCIRIYITDKGKEAAFKGKEAVDRANAEFFANLEADEQEVMLKMLLKLTKFLEDERKE